MMTRVLLLLSIVSLLLPLSACGHKDSPHTPSQIEKAERKKASKAAKKAAREAKEKQATENAEIPESQ